MRKYFKLNIHIILLFGLSFERYQWFCHVDDDVQVNILELSQYLQQYDAHKPYYVGKWPKNVLKGRRNVRVSVH